MAEYNKEKLYFLQLNENFFDSHMVKIIESLDDHGNDYVLFLLKIMCESTSWNGYLRMNAKKPYTDSALACVTRTPVEIVRSALKHFEELGVIEITSDESIYIPKVAEMTTQRTRGAIAKADKRGTKGGHLSTIDRDIDRDRYRDIYRDKDRNKKKVINKKDSSLSDNEVVEYAIELSRLDGVTLDLKWFDGNEIQYNLYLERMKENE